MGDINSGTELNSDLYMNHLEKGAVSQGTDYMQLSIWIHSITNVSIAEQ